MEINTVKTLVLDLVYNSEVQHLCSMCKEGPEFDPQH
jgi:hypothetical protein